ncbi:MAG: hypothetical protein AABY87_05750 [bacterium]
MKNKTFWICIAFVLVLCPHILLAAPAEEAHDYKKTLIRTADPILIEGSDLAGLTGKKIDAFRLFAFRQGVPAAIPFQIDQRDSKNDWVWDVALRGGKTEDDQDPRGEKILDDNDLLIFLSRDLGDRSDDVRQSLHAQKIVEIQVLDSAAHAEGWAYLAYDEDSPPPLSDIRYMRFSPDSRKVTSPVYELSYSKEHVAVLQDLSVDKHEILDRLKVRGKADIKLGPVNFSIRFNEEDVGGYMEGYIDGPVRTVIRSVNYVHLPLGLRTPLVNCDHFYYPEYTEVPLLLSIQFLVYKASLLLTADYQGSPFHQAVFDGDRKPAVLEQGVAAADPEPTLRKGRWIALAGGIGTVINLLKLPDEVESHATASLYLLNDPKARNKPETYPGSEPEAGFQITTEPGLPKGDYILYLIFYVSPGPYLPGLEEKAVHLLDDRLTWRVLEK